MADLEEEFPDIDPDQLQVLKRAFDSFDQEKRGAVSTDIVSTIMKMMGHHVNRQILDQVIEEVDEDKSGELEFNEFVVLAQRFMNEEDEEEMKKELKEAFRLYDKNGEGFIPTGVLREILSELDNNLSSEDLDGIIEEVDADGSGTVDFDEFMEMMTGWGSLEVSNEFPSHIYLFYFTWNNCNKHYRILCVRNEKLESI